MGKPTDERSAVTRLEFVKLRCVNDTGDDFPHIEGLAGIHRDHAIQFFCCKFRSCWGTVEKGFRLNYVQIFDRCTRQSQRVQVALRQMIRHTGQACVHIATTQVLGCDNLARGRFHQRGATQKNRSLIFDNDAFITHGWHIGAAGGAATHDHCYLCDALGAHVGLIEKDAAKMVPIRENLILVGQIGPA